MVSWKQTRVIHLLGGPKTQRGCDGIQGCDQVSLHSLPTTAILVPHPCISQPVVSGSTSPRPPLSLSALWRSSMLASVHLVLQLPGLYKYWGQGRAEPHSLPILEARSSKLQCSRATLSLKALGEGLPCQLSLRWLQVPLT